MSSFLKEIRAACSSMLNLTSFYSAVNSKGFRLMSCEVYFAEMSCLPAFFYPSLKFHFSMGACMWVCISHACVLTRLHVYVASWLRGSVAPWRRAQSPGCQHVVSERANLQTAAFCSTEGQHLIRNRMCLRVGQTEVSLQENRLSVVFLDYLQCSLSAADKKN